MGDWVGSELVGELVGDWVGGAVVSGWNTYAFFAPHAPMAKWVAVSETEAPKYDSPV